MTDPTFRCADAARDRGDPPLGTAPVAATYLLIEHLGPWRFDALAGAGWSESVVSALTAAVRATRSRLLFIRRPGRRSTDPVRAWAVTTVGGGTRWGSWRTEEDLLPASAALHAGATDDRTGRDNLLLVCAHGVHDTCCALRGRPVAAALARRWPAETWECSHVGGDRFAANLVVLPDGTYYGGLDADSAPDVVGAHLAGRLDTAHLRGSVRWPPAAQVAVGEIHRRLGPYAADEVRAERWPARGPRSWSVEVSVAGGRRFQVEVLAESRPAAVLTCAATQATSATHFRVEAVRPA